MPSNYLAAGYAPILFGARDGFGGLQWAVLFRVLDLDLVSPEGQREIILKLSALETDRIIKESKANEGPKGLIPGRKVPA